MSSNWSERIFKAHIMTQSNENKTLLERKESNVFVIFLSCFAAIGGFLGYYNLGILSGALLLMRPHFRLTTIWMELLMSTPIASATIFALVAGTIADMIGRRRTITIASIAFTVGDAIMATAYEKEIFLIGEIAVGIGIGKLKSFIRKPMLMYVTTLSTSFWAV